MSKKGNEKPVDLVTFAEKVIVMSNTVANTQNKSIIDQCNNLKSSGLLPDDAEMRKNIYEMTLMNNVNQFRDAVFMTVYNLACSEMKSFEALFAETVYRKMGLLFGNVSRSYGDDAAKILSTNINEMVQKSFSVRDTDIDPYGQSQFYDIIKEIVGTPILQLAYGAVGHDNFFESDVYNNLFDRLIMTYYSYLIGKWKATMFNAVVISIPELNPSPEMTDLIYCNIIEAIEDAANSLIPILDKVFRAICALALTGRSTDQTEFIKQFEDKMEAAGIPDKKEPASLPLDNLHL